MKRHLLILCILLGLVGTRASAYDFEVNGIYYNLISATEFTCEVTSGDVKYSGNIKIPATVSYSNRTVSVVRISGSAFKDCTDLTNVTIPNSVTKIESCTFSDCRYLKSVTIPNSVTSIGKCAFEDCFWLENITIPASVTSIGSNAFFFCGSTAVCITDLEAWCKIAFENDYSNPLSCGGHLYLNDEEVKDLIIPNSVTSIGNYAFYGCKGFTSITIPNSVTSIGSDAFDSCTSLTSITLPAGVTSIGNYAFCGCSSLTSITLPASVTSIGESAFFGCSSLTSVTLPAGVTSIGRSVFYGCSSLTSITLPAGVTSIGERAFEYCSSLTSITLPAGVTSIGVEAFQGCSLLTSITLPAGVTSIETQTFAYCSSLTSITLPEGVTSIGVSAFDGCTSLTSLTLPASVTSIGTAAFWDCSSLTSITLPAGVTSIGERAFWGCSSLTSIMLPANVTSIGEDAFYGCDNLKTVINLSALDIVKGSDTHGHVAYYADKVLTPGVYLDHTELTMQEDDKIVLEATVIPEGPVTWSSSDETVATVKDGVVTTLKPGEVTITAKAGEQTAICVITVKAKEVIVNPEEAFYSWQGAAGGATEKGGVATGHGACEGRVNYANGDYYTLSVSGKKANIDTDYILITLDQPLEANDKLEITAYRNKDTDANGTLYILFENGQAIDEGGEVVWNNVALGQEPNTNSYNVGGGAGSKTIKLSRSATSTNVFITKFVITRSANGIEEVEVVVPAENIIYNLQGQKLNTNSTQGLPRGLYIINGKKVLVK